MRRTLLVEVCSGPDAGLAFALPAGARAVFGRTAPADALLPSDRSVSRRHFAIAFDGLAARIEDLGSSHGTTLNDRPVDAASLLHGDRIGAGETTLRVRLVDVPPAHADVLGPAPADAAGTVLDTTATPAPVAPPTSETHALVLRTLRAEPSPLFAILDAARDPMVYLRIHECPERKQSLFDEDAAPSMAFVAPYLISLPKSSPFLDLLVREGWGESWGVFLTCDRPFEAVREHLRRLLRVERPDGRSTLFRFYDPRVMRTHLPACSAAERSAFFGPIAGFILEEPPGPLAFRPDSPRERGESDRLSATSHRW